MANKIYYRRCPHCMRYFSASTEAQVISNSVSHITNCGEKARQKRIEAKRKA